MRRKIAGLVLAAGLGVGGLGLTASPASANPPNNYGKAAHCYFTGGHVVFSHGHPVGCIKGHTFYRF